MRSETVRSPILPPTSRSTSRAPSTDWALLLIYTICIESTQVCCHTLIAGRILTCVDTPLEESIPALDEIRKAGKTKYIGLSECSVKTLRKANSSRFLLSKTFDIRPLTRSVVAKIDAVQAEYSAFETIHETDGLIEACKELGVAYVAYSPLGHGWLVDNFDYKSPDDFAPDDFRRTCQCFSSSDCWVRY